MMVYYKLEIPVVLEQKVKLDAEQLSLIQQLVGLVVVPVADVRSHSLLQVTNNALVVAVAQKYNTKCVQLFSKLFGHEFVQVGLEALPVIDSFYNSSQRNMQQSND